jgi:hypothetical protein
MSLGIDESALLWFMTGSGRLALKKSKSRNRYMKRFCVLVIIALAAVVPASATLLPLLAQQGTTTLASSPLRDDGTALPKNMAPMGRGQVTIRFTYTQGKDCYFYRLWHDNPPTLPSQRDIKMDTWFESVAGSARNPQRLGGTFLGSEKDRATLALLQGEPKALTGITLVRQFQVTGAYHAACDSPYREALAEIISQMGARIQYGKQVGPLLSGQDLADAVQRENSQGRPYIGDCGPLATYLEHVAGPTIGLTTVRGFLTSSSDGVYRHMRCVIPQENGDLIPVEPTGSAYSRNDVAKALTYVGIDNTSRVPYMLIMEVGRPGPEGYNLSFTDPVSKAVYKLPTGVVKLDYPKIQVFDEQGKPAAINQVPTVTVEWKQL